jgi:hypothetical protein
VVRAWKLIAAGRHARPRFVPHQTSVPQIPRKNTDGDLSKMIPAIDGNDRAEMVQVAEEAGARGMPSVMIF